MRLFTCERRVVVQQLLTGVFGGLGRVVVRLQKHRRQHGWTCPQPSPFLSVDARGAGKRSVLVFREDDEAHTHTCHSKARVRANGDERATWMETTSVFSALPPSVSQLKPSIFLHFPWNGSSLVVRVHRRQLGLNGTTRKKTSLLSCGTTRSDHSHSAREVRPCWRGMRPDFRVCDAAHLQLSGRAT